MGQYEKVKMYKHRFTESKLYRDNIEFYWLIDMGLIQTAQIKFSMVQSGLYTDEIIESDGWTAIR